MFTLSSGTLLVSRLVACRSGYVSAHKTVTSGYTVWGSSIRLELDGLQVSLKKPFFLDFYIRVIQ